MSIERCSISVVVAAQEGEADPAACLESLAGQEGIEPESLEVILVDGRLDQGTVGDSETSRLTVIPASGTPSLPELLGQVSKVDYRIGFSGDQEQRQLSG